MSPTDEEEFGEVEELDRGFWEPSSFVITPTKRKRLYNSYVRIACSETFLSGALQRN